MGRERKVGLFHTSTPQTSVELRMKKENRDLVASAGHLCEELRENGETASDAANHFKNFPRGGHSLIWPIRVCAAEQGMVLRVSSLKQGIQIHH